MSSFNTYAEQSLHYFTRAHEAPPTGPVGGAAAWRGDALADAELWRSTLRSDEVDELCAAVVAARSTGKPTAELRAADFPIPLLGQRLEAWRRELAQGRGFHVVRGVPVDAWSQEEAEVFFWCLGLHLGRPGAQNPQGDLLGHVVDTGDDAADPFVRLYRTSSNIRYHCDAADAVGLLCLRAARRGGASRIASSVWVHDEIAQRRPDLLGRLYEPFTLDIRNEDDSGALRHLPIPPCRFADGQLRTFFHSDYFRSAQRHDDVAPFTEAESELLGLYEEIASEPGVFLDMELAPGDIQWLSNHSVIHARTEYEDHEDPAKKRHLLRLWLSLA